MTPQEFKEYTAYLIDLQVKYIEAIGESTDIPLCDWSCALKEQLDFGDEDNVAASMRIFASERKTIKSDLIL